MVVGGFNESLLVILTRTIYLFNKLRESKQTIVSIYNFEEYPPSG